MRNLLIVFSWILLITSCSSIKKLITKKKEKPKAMVASRWKEVKRMKLDSSAVAFKDTIHIEFLPKNNYLLYKTGGFFYKNTYTMEGNDINFGMFVFTIKDKHFGKLALKSDSFIYVFAPDPSPSVLVTREIKNGSLVEIYAPVKTIDQMVGHWSEYKRTTKTELTSVDYSYIIKTIDITGGSSDGKLGYLYGTLDGNTPSWYVTAFANQLLECDGVGKRSFKVIKCEKNELILEEDNITYYFRQFR